MITIVVIDLLFQLINSPVQAGSTKNLLRTTGMSGLGRKELAKGNVIVFW